jgi:hypothetical protein
VRQGDRTLLVQAQEHARAGIAEIVDEAVVDAAIAGTGIERDIGNVELAQHAGDRVAAPHPVRRCARDRPVNLIALSRL